MQSPIGMAKGHEPCLARMVLAPGSPEILVAARIVAQEIRSGIRVCGSSADTGLPAWPGFL
jgi:hypothetical protein